MFGKVPVRRYPSGDVMYRARILAADAVTDVPEGSRVFVEAVKVWH